MLYLETHPEANNVLYTAETNCMIGVPSEHVFINADCFNILPTIPDNSIDLVVTDPPYDFSNLGGSSDRIGQSLQKALAPVGGFCSSFDIPRFYKELKRIQPKINAYIFCNKTQIPLYIKTFVTDGGCLFDVLIWNKTNPIPNYGGNKYSNDKEFCLYFKESGALCKPSCFADSRTIFTSPINQADRIRYRHPTIKPLSFIQTLIKNSSVEGDTILDPFGGSGTVSVACHLLNRNSISIEIDPTYFTIMTERYLEIAQN